MAEEEKKGWWIIGLLVAGGAAFYFFDVGLGSDQIADYTVFCTINNPTICSGNTGNHGNIWRKGQRVIYTVNKEQQFVVKQEEGEPPVRLQKCAVVDVKNWKCGEGLEDLFVGFTDGKYTESYRGISSKPAFVRHVSKSDWFSAQDSK